jgi:hypothetical protein
MTSSLWTLHITLSGLNTLLRKLASSFTHGLKHVHAQLNLSRFDAKITQYTHRIPLKVLTTSR